MCILYKCILKETKCLQSIYFLQIKPFTHGNFKYEHKLMIKKMEIH